MGSGSTHTGDGLSLIFVAVAALAADLIVGETPGAVFFVVAAAFQNQLHRSE